MDDIYKRLRDYLLSVSQFTDLVKSVYAEELPNNAVLPAVVLMETDDDPVSDLKGHSGMSVGEFYIFIYAATIQEVRAIKTLIKPVLMGRGVVIPGVSSMRMTGSGSPPIVHIPEKGYYQGLQIWSASYSEARTYA